MKPTTNNAAHQQDSRLAYRAFAVNLPLAVTFVLFVLGTFMGGEVADRELLPTVRFLSLVMLALALFAAFVTGTRCSCSRKRWTIGQISAGCTGLGAGLLWSGAAFFTGFGFLMIGALLGALLIASQLPERAKRRRLAMQAHLEKSHAG